MFTPGPWKYFKGRDNSSYAKFESGETWGTIKGDDFHIARIWDIPGSDANARLISKAPEMYELLKETQEEIAYILRHDLLPKYDSQRLADLHANIIHVTLQVEKEA